MARSYWVLGSLISAGININNEQLTSRSPREVEMMDAPKEQFARLNDYERCLAPFLSLN